jgi:trans-2-enoyl-CoA reductase
MPHSSICMAQDDYRTPGRIYRGQVTEVTLEAANDDEISETVKVMGGNQAGLCGRELP